MVRTSRRATSPRGLHDAAWPDMFANLQSAYSELTRTQFELERRASELSEGRDLFQLVIESMSEALFLIDRAGRVIRANPAARRLLQRPEDEILGRPFAAVAGSTDIPATAWQLLDRSASGSIETLEVEIHTRLGHVIPVSVSCQLVRDRRSKIIGMLVVARDITERKRMEDRLRFIAGASTLLASSLEYSTTLQRVAHLAVPTLADWCAVDIVAEDGSIARLAMAPVDPSQPRALIDPLQPLINGETEVQDVLQTGQSKFYPKVPAGKFHGTSAAQLRSLIIVPLAVRGRTLGVITLALAEPGRSYTPEDLALAQDLARRAAIAVDNARLYHDAQQLADDLQRRAAELAAANRELEAFSYSVSHDLRAPLRAVSGFSRILLEDHSGELSPEAKRYLDLVANNAVEMGHLIDDLLTFSRLSRQPLSKQFIYPTDVVHEVLGELHQADELRRVEFRIDDLPPCAADRTLLKLVFSNLLANALKFTRDRDVPVVEVGYHQRDDGCAYFVRDNGVGFDMRYADKLFGVFQRLHRPEDFEGTGVGLAIVQRIIHRHSGHVWAEAEIDRGATFWFTVGREHVDE